MSPSPQRSSKSSTSVSHLTHKRVPLSVLSLSPLISPLTRLNSTSNKIMTSTTTAGSSSGSNSLLPSPFVSTSSTLASPEHRLNHRRDRSMTPNSHAPGPLTTRYDNPAGLYSPRTLSRAATLERDSPARRMMDRDEQQTLAEDEDEDEEDSSDEQHSLAPRRAAVQPGTSPRRLLDMFLQGASPEIKRAVSSAAESPSKSPSGQSGVSGDSHVPVTQDLIPTWTFYEDSFEDQELLGTEGNVSVPAREPGDTEEVGMADMLVPPSNENAPPARTISSMAPPPYRHRRSTSLLSQSSTASVATETRHASNNAVVLTPPARSPASSSTVAQTPSPGTETEMRSDTVIVTPTRPSTPPSLDLDMLDDDDDDFDLPGSSSSSSLSIFAEADVDSFARPIQGPLPMFDLGLSGSELRSGAAVVHRDDDDHDTVAATRKGKRPSAEGPGASAAHDGMTEEDDMSEPPKKRRSSAQLQQV